MNKQQNTFEKYCGNDTLFISILSLSISFFILSLFMDMLLASNTLTPTEAVTEVSFRIVAWYAISLIIMGYYMKEKIGRYML